MPENVVGLGAAGLKFALAELEKVIHDLFKGSIRKVRLSDRLHFQWLMAIENDDTSVYRLASCRKTWFFLSRLG